jgi:hypothetical protein
MYVKMGNKNTFATMLVLAMPQAIIPTRSKVSPSASSFTTLFAKTTSKLLRIDTHVTNINHCKVLHVESWKLKIS